jgi:hypothetical protein
MSLRADVENTTTEQQITKVKMRDHSVKKKKALRELKSRISLPPEIKNGLNNNTNQQLTEANNIRLKLAQRSSYYQTGSSSVQGLNDVLNQSNVSLSRLSPQFTLSTGGVLSRNEHRRSMLDLGFGKIESYVKLEKLGEGKNNENINYVYIFFVRLLFKKKGTYATVYKGTSNLHNGYIALKEIRLEQEEGIIKCLLVI